MGKDLVDLTFYKGSSDEPWGFRLAGGKDFGQPLTISQVITQSLVEPLLLMDHKDSCLHSSDLCLQLLEFCSRHREDLYQDITGSGFLKCILQKFSV